MIYKEIETTANQRNPKKRNQREKAEVIHMVTHPFRSVLKRRRRLFILLHTKYSPHLLSLDLTHPRNLKKNPSRMRGRDSNDFGRLNGEYERDGLLFNEKERSDYTNINK